MKGNPNSANPRSTSRTSIRFIQLPFIRGRSQLRIRNCPEITSLFSVAYFWLTQGEESEV